MRSSATRRRATGSGTPPSVPRVAQLVPLAAATFGLGFGLDQAGLPSPYLFAALVVGLTVALTLRGRVSVPPLVFRASQAVTGVALGAQVRSSSLSALAHAWLPVALVSAATLVLSLAAGKLLARVTFVDAPTGALGMVAGGASGIVAMAAELGADDRLVAFMQYARVLVVVLLTPLLIPIAFPGHHGASVATGDGPLLGDAGAWLATAGLSLAGALAARLLRIPLLLGPMVLAGALTLSGATGPIDVPPLLRETAFAVIGLQVGLRFTIATVRQVGRLMLPVLVSIAEL